MKNKIEIKSIRIHGTKEIVIEIQFTIPDTYKESGLYTWKKCGELEIS